VIQNAIQSQRRNRFGTFKGAPDPPILIGGGLTGTEDESEEPDPGFSEPLGLFD